MVWSDQPIRRTAGNGIDIDYYERRAKQLRSQTVHAWFVRLARFCCSGSRKNPGHEYKETQPMYDLDILSLMADHNRWMNNNLYAVCARLSDEVRKQNLGAYFRSIHGTLNHLLLVDRLWLGRLRGEPYEVESLDQELCADYAMLERERVKTDRDIQEYVAMLEPSRLAYPVAYVSLLKKTTVTRPLGLILVHLFHHQTHHRGQITTLISQLGQDFGETDMIYMPDAGAMYFDSAAHFGEERA